MSGDIIYSQVPVAGTHVLTVRTGDDINVVMPEFCKAIGIDWSSQRRKIMNDPILSQGMVKLTIPSVSGKQDTSCLPLRMWHGWLFKLDVKNVNEASYPIVAALQREGYDVLHDYWVKGVAINPRATAQIEHSDRTARRRELPGLLDRYEAETNPEKRRILYALIVRACESESIEPPARDAIGYDAPQVADLLRQFWQHVALVEAKGDLINYHRNPMKLAFRRKQLEAAFAKNGIDFPISTAMLTALRSSKAPRFEAAGQVNTKVGDKKTIYAWVFDRSGWAA